MNEFFIGQKEDKKEKEDLFEKNILDFFDKIKDKKDFFDKINELISYKNYHEVLQRIEKLDSEYKIDLDILFEDEEYIGEYVNESGEKTDDKDKASFSANDFIESMQKYYSEEDSDIVDNFLYDIWVYKKKPEIKRKLEDELIEFDNKDSVEFLMKNEIGLDNDIIKEISKEKIDEMVKEERFDDIIKMSKKILEFFGLQNGTKIDLEDKGGIGVLNLINWVSKKNGWNRLYLLKPALIIALYMKGYKMYLDKDEEFNLVNDKVYRFIDKKNGIASMHDPTNQVEKYFNDLKIDFSEVKKWEHGWNQSQRLEFKDLEDINDFIIAKNAYKTIHGENAEEKREFLSKFVVDEKKDKKRIEDYKITDKEKKEFLESMKEEESDWRDSLRSYKATEKRKYEEIDLIDDKILESKKFKFKKKEDLVYKNTSAKEVSKILNIDFKDFDKMRNRDIITIKYKNSEFLEELPEGFLYKGGAARSVLERVLKVSSDSKPRDLDIVYRKDLKNNKKLIDKISKKYMLEDFNNGYGAELLEDDYFTTRDFTINEVLYDGFKIEATKECIMDIFEKKIRLTDFEKTKQINYCGWEKEYDGNRWQFLNFEQMIKTARKTDEGIICNIDEWYYIEDNDNNGEWIKNNYFNFSRESDQEEFLLTNDQKNDLVKYIDKKRKYLNEHPVIKWKLLAKAIRFISEKNIRNNNIRNGDDIDDYKNIYKYVKDLGIDKFHISLYLDRSVESGERELGEKYINQMIYCDMLPEFLMEEDDLIKSTVKYLKGENNKFEFGNVNRLLRKESNIDIGSFNKNQEFQNYLLEFSNNINIIESEKEYLEGGMYDFEFEDIEGKTKKERGGDVYSDIEINNKYEYYEEKYGDSFLRFKKKKNKEYEPIQQKITLNKKWKYIIFRFFFSFFLSFISLSNFLRK